MDTELQTAIEKIDKAVEAVLLQEPPRNMNAVWRSVAMQYSEEFVKANHEALQDAFYAAEARYCAVASWSN